MNIVWDDFSELLEYRSIINNLTDDWGICTAERKGGASFAVECNRVIITSNEPPPAWYGFDRRFLDIETEVAELKRPVAKVTPIERGENLFRYTNYPVNEPSTSQETVVIDNDSDQENRKPVEIMTRPMPPRRTFSQIFRGIRERGRGIVYEDSQDIYIRQALDDSELREARDNHMREQEEFRVYQIRSNESVWSNDSFIENVD